MNIYTLKIVGIRSETEDTVTVCFKQPALRKIMYKAGQYLTLIFRINGRRYIRPYSFSSAPIVDSLLEVTVKRVPNGIVSNHIHDIIQIGDSVEVMPPMGDFIYKNDDSKDQVCLWGVGSGITPLISLTKQILTESPAIKVNLIYGNRNHESTIFSKLINELLLQHPDRFRVWHFHTQLSISEELPFLVQGRITKESVFNVMKDIEKDQSIHYICGPLGLKESVKEALFQLNISESSIFSEDFELIKDPKQFEEIHTQTIGLSFNGNKFDLEVIKGKSILEAALDADIEIPYSCQTGNCSTCKGRLQAGGLKMIGLNKEREDLLSDEYLLCCSHPLTDDVCIEI